MYQFKTQQTITDFSDADIESQYAMGFVFTRLGKGVMREVRSLRVNLNDFKLTSENQRILRKSMLVSYKLEDLPYKDYHWSIGKAGYDHFSRKFGEGTISVNKIKEMFTEPDRSNMNSVFVYRKPDIPEPWGYCLACSTSSISHYAYPFIVFTRDTIGSSEGFFISGMTMMTQAIVLANRMRMNYVYLGSVHDEKAAYKLQFEGLEWWDGKVWNQDILELKKLIKK